MAKSAIRVAALIATYQREDLLISRSLRSVYSQKRLPDSLTIVNDATNALSLETLKKIHQDLPGTIKLNIIQNNRTKGASGAWNTGIVNILENTKSLESTYIAILDDDDEWKDNHIEECTKNARNHDIIINGIIRDEGNKIEKYKIPETLNVKDFLIGNPGVQGSNLFIRLSTLLKAGMFDENLQSSTDRDLCIRILDLCPKIFSTNIYTVIHHAENTRKRLSTPLSPQKLEGLSSFWNKYNSQMNEFEKNSFVNRARNLFGFELKPIVKVKTKKMSVPKQLKSFQLVVGIIAGSAQQLLPLINDILVLSRESFIENIELVIMNNGSSLPELKNIIDVARKKGLSSLILSKTDIFENSKDELAERILPISIARSILQKFLAEYIQNKNNCIVWLLDDDMRLPDCTKSYLKWLPIFRLKNIDVLIGCYEGGSPNPSTNAVRAQLLDLFHNLKWLYTMDGKELLPDRKNENQILMNKYPDYYYDLSRKHYGHLESPFWIVPDNAKETVYEARQRVLMNLSKILTGEAFFRPLICQLPVNPLEEAKDSCNRGGTTFIFNKKALAYTPNTIIEISGRTSRRSDMLWALINRYNYGMEIKSVNFPIYHHRFINNKTELNFDKTIDEIRGSVIYSALSEYFAENPKGNFNFSKYQVDEISIKINSLLKVRLLMYKLNFQRINGLVKAIKRIDDKNEDLCLYLRYIEDWFSNKNLKKIIQASNRLNTLELKTYLKSLSNQISYFRKNKFSTLYNDYESH